MFDLSKELQDYYDRSCRGDLNHSSRHSQSYFPHTEGAWRPDKVTLGFAVIYHCLLHLMALQVGMVKAHPVS